MWVIYVLLGTGLLVYSRPKIRRAIDSYAIQSELNKLIKSGYKVIKNDSIGDIKADYPVIVKIVVTFAP